MSIKCIKVEHDAQRKRVTRAYDVSSRHGRKSFVNNEVTKLAKMWGFSENDYDHDRYNRTGWKTFKMEVAYKIGFVFIYKSPSGLFSIRGDIWGTTQYLDINSALFANIKRMRISYSSFGGFKSELDQLDKIEASLQVEQISLF